MSNFTDFISGGSVTQNKLDLQTPHQGQKL